jgi:uncharacterized protein (TIGR02646 family)
MVHTPRRTAAPARLVRNRQRWTARFARICAGECQGDWATRIAKAVIRGSLLTITHGKCIYCESPLGVTSELNIEHYIAKTVKPESAFEWTNLLPACRLCNGQKGEADHGGRLLKPDDEDPEPYFWIHPDTGKLEPHPALNDDQRNRAERTIEMCNLQRGALCTQRIEMMNRIYGWIDTMTADGWDRLAHPATPYKLVLRHVLTQKGLSVRADEDRRRFMAPVPDS